MDPMTAFLLSMQAAGLVTSFFGAKSQNESIALGRRLENAQFSTNMEAIKLQSAQGSLAEMKDVRQNISSQIAVNAARGNRGASSVAGINETSRNFADDEGQSLLKDAFNTIPVTSLLTQRDKKASTNNAGANSGAKSFNWGF